MKKICILLPAYNEELVIGKTIESLIDSGFKSENIYVVDDCSSDQTFSVTKAYTENVATVPMNGGKARAQIYALEKFDLLRRYDYVLMMDCDSTVSNNFKEIVYNNIHSHPTVDLFIGQVKNAHADNLISALRTIEYTFSHEIVKKGQSNFGVIYVAPGCASIYSTKMLSKLTIDHSTLAEDMDLTIQVQELNGKIKYLHDAHVITQDPQSYKDYQKQITRWFRGFWQIIDKYNVLKFGLHSHVTPYLFYLMLESLVANRIFTSLFFLAFLMSWKVVVFGLVLDFCVFFLISLWAAHKTKRYSICLKTPLIYPIMFYNAYVFVKCFFEVIVFRKKSFGWNKVDRYIGD